MNFNLTAPTDVIEHAIRHVFSFVPEDIWRRKIYALARKARLDSESKILIEDRYEIEVGLAKILSVMQNDHLRPDCVEDEHVYCAASFFHMLSQLYKQLPVDIHKELSARVKSYLNKNDDLNPLHLELSTAIDFMYADFEVHFSDFNKRGGYDILVYKENLQLEVECKYFRSKTKPNQCNVDFAISFLSSKDERETLLKKMKTDILGASKKQLTGKIPGMLAIQLGELEDKDLKAAHSSWNESNDPFMQMLNEVFARRSHLVGVWIMARGRPRRHTLRMPHDTMTYTTGDGYILSYANSYHPQGRQFRSEFS